MMEELDSLDCSEKTKQKKPSKDKKKDIQHVGLALLMTF